MMSKFIYFLMICFYLWAVNNWRIGCAIAWVVYPLIILILAAMRERRRCYA